MLTGVQYACIIIDNSKPCKQLTVFNSQSLDCKMSSVKRIFGEAIITKDAEAQCKLVEIPRTDLIVESKGDRRKGNKTIIASKPNPFDSCYNLSEIANTD